MPSGRKSTVATVALSLGGEFAVLSESENRHRELLQNAQALLDNAEAALAAETARSSALKVALQRSGTIATEAEEAARDAQRTSAQLTSRALAESVASRALHEEVALLEALEELCK